MNQELSLPDRVHFPNKGVYIKNLVIALLFLAGGAFFLKIGVQGYNRTDYDHPFSQFRYIKLIFAASVVELGSGVFLLAYFRCLVLGVPAVVITGTGVSYRGIWGRWRSAEWQNLGPARVVIVGTKGTKDYIQATLTGARPEGKTNSDGAFKVPIAGLRDSATEIAGSMNRFRAQATGDWAGGTAPSIERLADPAEAAAAEKKARALARLSARLRWVGWFFAAFIPLDLVSVLILKHASPQIPWELFAFAPILFGVALAFWMTRKRQLPR